MSASDGARGDVEAASPSGRPHFRVAPVCGTAAPLFNPAELGPSGRLDAGQLEIVLTTGTVRKLVRVAEKSLTPEKRALQLDATRLARRATPGEADTLELFASLESAVLSEGLRELIEDEPNPFIQERMRTAIASLIEETILERDAGSGSGAVHSPTVPPDLARLKALSVPFEDSSRQPAVQAIELREAFYLNLLDIIFLPPQQSPVIAAGLPHVVHWTPTEAAAPVDFGRAYHAYQVRWESAPGMEATGGFSITSAPVRSLDLMPVTVVRFFSASGSKGGRQGEPTLLGITTLLLKDFACAEKPFKSICRAIEAPINYEVLPNVEHPEPVARFRTSWKTARFLEEHGISPGLCARAITRSVSSHGTCIRLDVNWALRTAPATDFSGELFVMSRFVPANAGFSDRAAPSAAAMRDGEFVAHAAPAAAHGAALPRLPYNPNLAETVWQKRLCESLIGSACRVPAQWEFERLDYADIRRHEELTQHLEEHALWQWRGFLTTPRADGRKIPGGEAQWAAVERAAQSAGVATGPSDTAWLGTLSELCGASLPRFLVEVWCGDEFVGEKLLPKLFDLKRVFQTQPFVKLEVSDFRTSLTRPDWRKGAARRMTVGTWLRLSAVWRCVSASAGRLALTVRDIRNVATPSRDAGLTQKQAPEVRVFRHAPEGARNDWTEVLRFPPFDCALYFLAPGQARKAMPDWTWDAAAMGCPEPDWRNCFSWNDPGKAVAVEQEVAVPMGEQCGVETHLNFEALMREHTVVMDRICALTRRGIPTVMRPLLWKELSGANVLKSVMDAHFAEVVREPQRMNCKTTFAYLLMRTEARESPAIYGLIDQDAAALQQRHGVTDAAIDSIRRVARALVVFSSVDIRSPTLIQSVPQVSGTGAGAAGGAAGESATFRTADDDLDLTWEKHRAAVGLPVMYSEALLNLIYALSLDFDGIRLTEEEVFMIVYALTGAGNSKRGILKAFFRDYFLLVSRKQLQSPERYTFADETPAPLSDATFVRAAVEVLLPDLAAVLHRAGAHAEFMLFGPLHSLFVGYLPAQSLFRLWDLLVNQLMRQQDFTGVGMGELQEEAREKIAGGGNIMRDRGAASGAGGSGSNAVCGGASSLAARIFDDSFGRRVLASFAFAILARALRNAPVEATSAELLQTFESEMKLLRDPSDVIALIRNADFLLFTSAPHARRVFELWKYYTDNRNAQLELFKTQNKLLQEIAMPWQELQGHDTPTHVIMEALPPDDPWRLFRPRTAKTGLTTEDMLRGIYPALKYHTVFAPPPVRNLPREGLGRLIIKMDELNVFGGKLDCYPEVRVRVGRERQTKRALEFAATDRFIWRTNNVFQFVLTSPPPYRVELEVTNDATGAVIAELRPGFKIKKLFTQGETYHLFTSHELRGMERVALNVSWYMYTNSVRMFLPAAAPQGATAAPGLSPGSGTWGDLCATVAMKVRPPLEKVRRQLRQDLLAGGAVGKATPATGAGAAMSLASRFPVTGSPDSGLPPPAPIQVRPAVYGASKHVLDDVLFHTLPSLLPYVDALCAHFGAGLVSLDEMPLDELHANAAVPMRELVASLIIASRGPIAAKAVLLFDLFGQHEPQLDTQNGTLRLFYDETAPPALPRDLDRELARLEPLLPDRALPSIRSDPRVISNCISLAGAVACVLCILRRGCVHADYWEAVQMAAAVFDPRRVAPRVVAAAISTVKPVAHVDERHDPNNPLRAVMVRAIQGKDSVPEREFHELTKDVTSQVQQALVENAVANGVLGFDFTVMRSLQTLGMDDPFPGVAKSLRIAFSRSTGTVPKTEVICVEVDAEGRFWAGSGGNKRTKAAATAPGTPPSAAAEAASSHEDRLRDPSYMFDLRSIIIDKRMFVSRLLGNELLSAILRRPTAIDRVSFEKPSLPLLITIPLSLDKESLGGLRPLSFDSAHRKKVGSPRQQDRQAPLESPARTTRTSQAIEDDGGRFSGGEESEVDLGQLYTPNATPSARRDGFADADAPLPPPPPQMLVVEPVVARSLDSRSLGAQQGAASSLRPRPSAARSQSPDEPLTLFVTVLEGSGLYNADTFSKMDPFVKVILADYSNTTPVLEGAGTEPVWRATLQVPYRADADALIFEIWDKDLLQDDVVGTARFEGLRDLINADRASGRPAAYYARKLPVIRKGAEHGTLSVAVKAAFNPAQAEQPLPKLKIVAKKARDLHLPDGSGDISSPICVVHYGFQNGQTQSAIQVEGLRGNAPEWNSSFSFEQDPPTAHEVHFEVFNHATSSDLQGAVLIGSARLDIPAVLTDVNQIFVGELELADESGFFRGFLEVQARYDVPPPGPLADLLRITLENAVFTDPLKNDSCVAVRCSIGPHGDETDGAPQTPFEAASRKACLTYSGYLRKWCFRDISSGTVVSDVSRAFRSSDGTRVSFANETLEYRYSGQPLIKLVLFDPETGSDGREGQSAHGTCALDLWDCIRERRTEGSVVIYGLDGRVCGHLNFGVHFIALGPDREMAGNARITLKAWEVREPEMRGTGGFSPGGLPPSPSLERLNFSVVLRNDAVGGTVEHRTPEMAEQPRAGEFPPDLRFDFAGPGPTVLFEFNDSQDAAPAKGRLSLVDALLNGGKPVIQRVFLYRGTELAGSITVLMKLTSPPKPAPDFIKVRMHKVYLPQDALPGAALGALRCIAEEPTTGAVHSLGDVEAAQPGEVLSDGMRRLPRSCFFLTEYNVVAPQIVLRVLGGPSPGTASPEAVVQTVAPNHEPEIVRAEIDVWELLSGGERVFERRSVPLRLRDGTKVGRAVVTLDFFSRTVAPEAILGLRAAVRSGRDLGMARGDYFERLNPFVTVRLGPHACSRTRTQRDGGTEVDFMDEEVFVDWPDKHALHDEALVEVWDSTSSSVESAQDECGEGSLLGSGKVHLWDHFRNPRAVWAGWVWLKTPAGREAGRVCIALQLLCKAAIRLAFDVSADQLPVGFQQVPRDRIGQNLSVSGMKVHVGAQCRALGRVATRCLAMADGGRSDPEYHSVAEILADPDAHTLASVLTGMYVDPARFDALWFRDSDQTPVVLDDAADLAEYAVHGLHVKTASPRPHVVFLQRKSAPLEADGAVYAQQGAADAAGAAAATTAATLYPLALTTFPKARPEEFGSGLKAPLAGGVAGGAVAAIDAVRFAQVEIHPGIPVSAMNLGWAQLKLAGAAQRGLSHLHLLRGKARDELWVPCVITNNASEAASEGPEIVMLQFNETRRGYDDPLLSRPMIVKNRMVLINFAFNNSAPPYTYDLCLPEGVSKRKITVAVGWKAPQPFSHPRSARRRGGTGDSPRRTARTTASGSAPHSPPPSLGTTISFLSTSGRSSASQSFDRGSVVSSERESEGARPFSESAANGCATGFDRYRHRLDDTGDDEFAQDDVSTEGLHFAPSDSRIHSPRPSVLASHRQRSPKHHAVPPIRALDERATSPVSAPPEQSDAVRQWGNRESSGPPERLSFVRKSLSSLRGWGASAAERNR